MQLVANHYLFIDYPLSISYPSILKTVDYLSDDNYLVINIHPVCNHHKGYTTKSKSNKIIKISIILY